MQLQFLPNDPSVSSYPYFVMCQMHWQVSANHEPIPHRLVFKAVFLGEEEN